MGATRGSRAPGGGGAALSRVYPLRGSSWLSAILTRAPEFAARFLREVYFGSMGRSRRLCLARRVTIAEVFARGAFSWLVGYFWRNFLRRLLRDMYPLRIYA